MLLLESDVAVMFGQNSCCPILLDISGDWDFSDKIIENLALKCGVFESR
ncbi:hypothetical protein K9M79_08330 [Candidatus Woesearchaeota archaeon]|nr:hypothetical protein [Candidatus Woesearchaeota archaeon]